LALLLADDEEFTIEPGMMARVVPGQMRKLITRDQPAQVLVIGGIPGKALNSPSVHGGRRLDVADPHAPAQVTRRSPFADDARLSLARALFGNRRRCALRHAHVSITESLRETEVGEGAFAARIARDAR
jgi:hypothetical protein